LRVGANGESRYFVYRLDNLVNGCFGTSTIGKSQGKAEISRDLAGWVLPTRKALCRELSSISCEDQRISSVARHPFAGTTLGKRRPRRLSECKSAGLETDDAVYREPKLPCTVPKRAGTGRWIADRSNPR
jgi:hypothetical protein